MNGASQDVARGGAGLSARSIMGGNQPNQARILIVDDHPDNILLLEKMLEQEGHVNLMSATDSRQVQSLHLKWRFDLNVLDLQISQLDGRQVMHGLAGTVQGPLPADPGHHRGYGQGVPFARHRH